MNLEAEYIEHQVFIKLDEIIYFYKYLSLSISRFATQSIGTIYNIDSFVYSSVQGTLESTKIILQNGRINDAYALLRKYYDSTIINVYSNLYLNDNFSIKNFVAHKINNWLKGEDRLPNYRIMSQYIRGSNKLKEINDLLYKDGRYKEIRDRCNDHAHYNFYKNVLLNDNEIYLNNRVSVLDVFSKDLEQIFILHISYLFYLRDYYMMSSDYIDSLDCGLTPEEDSQYIVATFVQEIFDTVIKKNRMDLAETIKNKTSMKLD